MPEEPLGETWQYHPEYHKMASFLGLDQHDRQDFGVAKKVSLIRDWAGIKGKDTIDDALKTVDGVRKGIGTQARGKTLIDQLFQHIRLDMDSSKQTPLRADGVPHRPVEKKEKQSSVKNIVQSAVQSSIQGMVKNALSDKKLLTSTVQQVIKESLK